MAAAAPCTKGWGDQGTSGGDRRREEAWRWVGLRLSEMGIRLGPQAVWIAISETRPGGPTDQNNWSLCSEPWSKAEADTLATATSGAIPSTQPS